MTTKINSTRTKSSNKSNKNHNTFVFVLGPVFDGKAVRYNPVNGIDCGITKLIKTRKSIEWVLPKSAKAGDKVVFAYPVDIESRLAFVSQIIDRNWKTFTSRLGIDARKLSDLIGDDFARAYEFSGKAFAEATVKSMNKTATLSKFQDIDHPFTVPGVAEGFAHPTEPFSCRKVEGEYKEAFDEAIKKQRRNRRRPRTRTKQQCKVV